jgi:hypothetical protein
MLLKYTNTTFVQQHQPLGDAQARPPQSSHGPTAVLAMLGFRRACFKFYRIFLELLATTLDEQLSIQSYITAEITQYGSRQAG